ncbi:MAG: hypothetical protein L6Q71_07950 [Planctomycetes bacterium]|nr:hypothetical protein [Planctomycetota bacterium]NUQ33352.1 hypothetical protein [Planctomycetaceae bacterium]
MTSFHQQRKSQEQLHEVTRAQAMARNQRRAPFEEISKLAREARREVADVANIFNCPYKHGKVKGAALTLDCLVSICEKHLSEIQ